MIDLSLYKNHDWNIEEYDSGFYYLSCKKCKYVIRERFIPTSSGLYFVAFIGGQENHIKKFNATVKEINLIRKEIYSCEEVIIKSLIE